DDLLVPLRRRAHALIDELYESETWVFKDPRVTHTLPFWKGVIGPMRYVLCLRSPAAVAASFEARNAEINPFEPAARLWLDGTARALAETNDAPRLALFYDDWFRDFDAQLARLAYFCIGRAPTRAENAETRAFVDLSLMHQARTAAIAADRR